MMENKKVKSYKKKNKYINPHKKFLKRACFAIFYGFWVIITMLKRDSKNHKNLNIQNLKKFLMIKKPWVFWVNHATF